MSTTIYGKYGCENCKQAKEILGSEAEYRDFRDIFDKYEPNEAQSIVTATRGQLPIIVVENERGRLVMGVGESTEFQACKNGSCAIDIKNKERAK